MPRAGAQQRRDLVAQRLAAAGGHQHQRVAAGDDMVDDLFLRAAEGGVAENVAENVSCRGENVGHCAVSRAESRAA